MTYSEQLANGIEIKIKVGETYNKLNGVFNGPTGPDWTPAFTEAMYHGLVSPKKHATRVDVGPVNFSIYYDPADTDHQALLTAARGKVETDFKIVLPDTGAEEIGFKAYAAAAFKGEVEGFLVYDVTLTIDGDVTDTL